MYVDPHPLFNANDTKQHLSFATNRQIHSRSRLRTRKHVGVFHRGNQEEVARNCAKYVYLYRGCCWRRRLSNTCFLGGLGYLEIKKPEDYDNLPEHLREFPKKFVVTSSVTHQLHCLYAIAEAYSALSSNSSRVPEETPWHLTHCFDYVRQSVMCCGDVALEGQQTTFPKGFDGSDGWDAKHVCKDYSQVYDYLESNRADNKLWI